MVQPHERSGLLVTGRRCASAAARPPPSHRAETRLIRRRRQVHPNGPMTESAPKLFISYRREETSSHAGRLYDAVAARFGERNVFMDVELEPGIDFVDRIKEVVGSCQVFLVVVGPTWATLANGGSRTTRSCH